MNTPESSSFNPTYLWVPSIERTNLDEPIERALYKMNNQDPRQLIDRLKKGVEKSNGGVVYSILAGENPEEYSTTEAMVIFNPFGNTATAGQLVRCEFIREVAKEYDIVDDEGKLVPVIMLAAPGIGGSNLRLTKNERERINKGELGIFAKRQLKTVSERGFGIIAAKGFSQGGVLALHAGAEGYSTGLDVIEVTSGDPSNSETRNKLELGKDLSKSKVSDLKEAIKSTKLRPQQKAYGTGVIDSGRFLLSVPNRANLALYGGLGANSFVNLTGTILNEGIKLVVGYGDNGDAIANPSTIEPSLAYLYDVFGPNSFTSVKVQGANHTWENQLTLLAKLYMI